MEKNGSSSIGINIHPPFPFGKDEIYGLDNPAPSKCSVLPELGAAFSSCTLESAGAAIDKSISVGVNIGKMPGLYGGKGGRE